MAFEDYYQLIDEETKVVPKWSAIRNTIRFIAAVAVLALWMCLSHNFYQKIAAECPALAMGMTMFLTFVSFSIAAGLTFPFTVRLWFDTFAGWLGNFYSTAVAFGILVSFPFQLISVPMNMREAEFCIFGSSWILYLMLFWFCVNALPILGGVAYLAVNLWRLISLFWVCRDSRSPV